MDNPGPPPAMLGYMFERVAKLEAEVAELRAFKVSVMNWAEQNRDFYVDQVNEAAAFFELFGE